MKKIQSEKQNVHIIKAKCMLYKFNTIPLYDATILCENGNNRSNNITITNIFTTIESKVYTNTILDEPCNS